MSSPTLAMIMTAGDGPVVTRTGPNAAITVDPAALPALQGMQVSAAQQRKPPAHNDTRPPSSAAAQAGGNILDPAVANALVATGQGSPDNAANYPYTFSAADVNDRVSTPSTGASAAPPVATDTVSRDSVIEPHATVGRTAVVVMICSYVSCRYQPVRCRSCAGRV